MGGALALVVFLISLCFELFMLVVGLSISVLVVLIRGLVPRIKRHRLNRKERIRRRTAPPPLTYTERQRLDRERQHLDPPDADEVCAFIRAVTPTPREIEIQTIGVSVTHEKQVHVYSFARHGKAGLDENDIPAFAEQINQQFGGKYELQDRRSYQSGGDRSGKTLVTCAPDEPDEQPAPQGPAIPAATDAKPIDLFNGFETEDSAESFRH